MQPHRRHPRFPRLLRSVLLSLVHLLSNLCLNLSLVPLLSNLCLNFLTMHHVLIPRRFTVSIHAYQTLTQTKQLRELHSLPCVLPMRPRPMSDLICPRVAPGIGFLLAILAPTPNAAAAARTQMHPSSCAGGVVSFKTQWISSLVNLAHEYPVSGVVAERVASQTMLPCLSTCRLAMLVRRGLW